MKPEIIITAKGHAGTQATLHQDFTCHLLHEAKDREAFLRQHAPGVRGLATFGPMPVDGRFMDALPKLEIIANFGVGVDAINLADAKSRGIIVTNTPDVLNEAVADTALALILNTVRQFPQAERHLRAGRWASQAPYPLTADAGGKTLGILGLGRIGEAIAKRALACGMKIRYHNRNRKDAPYPYDPDPVTLAKESDVLMVVTPGGPETHKLVGAKVEALIVGALPDVQLHGVGDLGDRLRIPRVHPGAQHCQRHDPVHRPGVEIARTQRTGQTL
jgi:lactate dehydrogenase-like 2-hydroxyacid dehydrogenase